MNMRIALDPAAAAGRRSDPVQAHRSDPLEREAERSASRICADATARWREAPLPLAGAGAGAPLARAAEAVVSRALGGAGEALDRTTRGDMEARFGHDFGTVRIHRGAAASASAQQLGARAFTHGERIVFGGGQFAPAHASGRRLLAHELSHVVQQRNGAQPVIQRDVIDDVRDKLSYGLIDWAITDAEANDSLALLATIPDANLPADLARLGTKYVSRLLDNLPDAAKSGDAYQRVIAALGSSGTMDYVDEQLSYGVFDWAVTNDEVARVFNVFTNLPAGEREPFLVGLEKTGKLGRLFDNASYGQITMHLGPWMSSLTAGRLTKDQRKVMKALVKHGPTDPIDLLRQATQLRYDVTVAPSTIPGRKPVAWDAKMLRQTYLALDDLPDAHVARNAMLQRFGQFEKPSTTLANGETVITAGTYYEPQTELAVNVKKEGDVASTLIHETGHAVDAQMGWSTGPEPAKPKRGGWKEYAGHGTCAHEMVDDANAGIKSKLNAAQRTDVENDMVAAMGNRSAASLKRDIRGHAWFAGLARADKGEVLDDPALEALPIGLEKPWFTAAGGGKHLGDHVYQESYQPTWVRYRHEARNRLLTKYQFRDAGEWFAECYEAYYDPGNKVKGDRLNKVDPDTKTYFDNNVDTLATSR
ncbi:MAG: DUF4157 domain-containing protein [Rhodocyclaceae bacterium]|nr:DUF4157 domain-containing protein [Rhodocyclaceae bacterium]